MKCLFSNVDEWKIIQDKIEIKENRLAESIMSIGNGYMGMRGNYEENYSGDTHKGSYIAGVWFPDKTRVGGKMGIQNTLVKFLIQSTI